MTQIASLLVVATVFSWLIVYNICILQSERGAYMRDKTTYAGSWAKKVGGGGGAYARGGA